MSLPHGPIDGRDAQHVEREPDPAKREAMVCTLATYRRPDRLAAGDTAPALRLSALEGRGTFDLGGPRRRPLALFFGSYT